MGAVLKGLGHAQHHQFGTGAEGSYCYARGRACPTPVSVYNRGSLGCVQESRENALTTILVHFVAYSVKGNALTLILFNYVAYGSCATAV